MVEIVKSGGWLMAPIILGAIIAMGIILERFWTLQQKRVIPEDLTSKVWGWVKKDQLDQRQIQSLHQGSPLGKILAAGLINRDRERAVMKDSIEDLSERRLVRDHVLPQVDVVTVPHHGSRTSSTGSFVAALGPSIAIVSAGHGNRWGFPKDDVVGRWRHAGADVLQTAASGAITVRVCKHAGIVSVAQNREQRRRIWHAAVTNAGKKGD